MNFQFVSDETNLTKTVRNGGCGLSAAEVRAVRTWQTTDFNFNMHGSYHGTDGGGHYIYLYATPTPPAGDMPRIWISGTKAGQFVNGTGASLKTKHLTDAARVVAANQALFLKIVKNINA